MTPAPSLLLNPSNWRRNIMTSALPNYKAPVSIGGTRSQDVLKINFDERWGGGPGFRISHKESWGSCIIFWTSMLFRCFMRSLGLVVLEDYLIFCCLGLVAVYFKLTSEGYQATRSIFRSFLNQCIF